MPRSKPASDVASVLRFGVKPGDPEFDWLFRKPVPITQHPGVVSGPFPIGHSDRPATSRTIPDDLCTVARELRNQIEMLDMADRGHRDIEDAIADALEKWAQQAKVGPQNWRQRVLVRFPNGGAPPSRWERFKRFMEWRAK